MLILGVDPGSTNTALALVQYESETSTFTVVHTALRNNKSPLHAVTAGSVLKSILCLLDEAKGVDSTNPVPFDAIAIEKQWSTGNAVVETAAATYGLLVRRPILSINQMRVKKYLGLGHRGHHGNKRDSLLFVRSQLGLDAISDHNIADAVLLCVYSVCRLHDQAQLLGRVSAVLDDCKVAPGVKFNRSLFTFKMGAPVGADKPVHILKHGADDAAESRAGGVHAADGREKQKDREPAAAGEAGGEAGHGDLPLDAAVLSGDEADRRPGT
jgi:Holliday junction resolvasome RuvABC endonuclease subunit